MIEVKCPRCGKVTTYYLLDKETKTYRCGICGTKKSMKRNAHN